MLANQLIQRFNPSIKQLLFISAALGIAVCVILGTKQIINMNENVTRYQQNEVVVNIMSVLDNVAHQHALERGLSAGFVGSGNKAVFKRLEAQRKLADESVLNLERFLLTVDKSKLNLSFIDMLYGRLSKKSMIRQQVDARNGSQFFIYYSSINRKVSKRTAITPSIFI
ncbi:nitrate- and nitrite sensing domain-containing protein [Opacimonas viscosa]|uniref:Nitrate- and nitrite sensing domain-containing protein n=1 Tax=Opacimonas viscosa TaxID=2961944 RepID=A0AA41WZL1_9ALTE|nr:nitrate- and nitrite sensing domain-containing protein [Opacimonas viscosa]MCP3429409.1 nitrate- and nitrite sensing domain-containing protein [Opacimonas viscosa]